MTTPTYQITCTFNQRIATDVHEIRFDKPKNLTFNPGQFLLFLVPSLQNQSDIEPRAMSIASSPKEDELIFAAKLKAGGRISTWITDMLTIGTVVDIQGPFGIFGLNRKTSKDYFLIATSTGVGPFRSQLLSVLPTDTNRRIDLVFGARSEEDLFWTDQFEALARQHKNFFLHLALSNPSPSWKGHRGRVQTLVPQIVRDFKNKSVYICGNPEMTKELKQLCLAEWNVPKEDVHMEGYI
ncbi:hypothetical protein HYZ98_01135 [Candidatus Peregrinibacteria bacterium]|nr:hypothetical protein [Candidatus Peregrinibacteria bacterium]